MDLIGTLVSVGAMLVAGAATKHKTKFNHKAIGLPQNGVLGQGIAAVFGGSPGEGAMLTLYTEAAVGVGKGLFHIGRGLFRRKR